MKRAVVIGLLFVALGSAAWALIGTPCDPEKDFVRVALISHWKDLPHKNQEESKARVDEVNRMMGKPFWKYDPTPNTPLYACLSYGAATVADWWAQELFWQLPRYSSYTHGKLETGFNPRKLELRYRKRGKWDLLNYSMTRLQERDPITGEPVPVRPKGYAKLLVETEEETINDPIGGDQYSYKKTDYPMEGKYHAVVSKNWNRSGVEAKLIKAIKDFGPLYVQFEIPGKHYLFGTHAPVVIGYGTLKTGKTVFICHDSFGNFPSTKKQDGFGAAAYRYVNADEIDEAIVFPHRPRGMAFPMPGGLGIKFCNAGGRNICVRRAFINAGGQAREMQKMSPSVFYSAVPSIAGSKVQVYVEADFYMAENGRGHWLSLTVRGK